MGGYNYLYTMELETQTKQNNKNNWCTLTQYDCFLTTFWIQL